MATAESQSRHHFPNIGKRFFAVKRTYQYALWGRAGAVVQKSPAGRWPFFNQFIAASFSEVYWEKQVRPLFTLGFLGTAPSHYVLTDYNAGSKA